MRRRLAFIPRGDAEDASLLIRRKTGVELALLDSKAVVAPGLTPKAAGKDQRSIAGLLIEPTADAIQEVRVLERGAFTDPDGDQGRLGGDPGVPPTAAIPVSRGNPRTGRAVAMGVPDLKS